MSSSQSSSRSSEPPRIKRATGAVLHVLSGARAGARCVLSADFATLGRHPGSDLAFDSDQDTEVSTRHAAVFRQGPGYVVRDLGSANGTWVNGARVRGDQTLEPGDRIRLGARGPEVEFVVEAVDDRVPAPPAPPAPVAELHTLPPQPAVRPVIGQEQSTTDLKIRVEVARQTDRLRRRLLGIVLMVLAGMALLMGWLAWSSYQTRLEVARERDRLLARVDSVDAVLRNAAERAAGLRQALDSARGEAELLRRSITRRATSEAALASLDSEVLSTIQKHDPLLRAARFDAGDITTTNARSLVMVFVDRGDSGRVSGTGFVVRTSADTGWIVTSKHLFPGGDGSEPPRVVLIFHGGKVAWRARLVTLHQSADLALIRVLAWGHVIPIQSVNPGATVRAGEPVAILGFPHGLDTQEGDWRERGLRSSTTTGTLASVGSDRLQIDGYGAPGSSGSPVFNAAGEVIGVLSGGMPESGGRMIVAVPAAAMAAWGILPKQDSLR